MRFTKLVLGVLPTMACLLALTGLAASPANASVSLQKNVSHGTSQSVTFGVGAVCGWAANDLQMSVNGDWNSTSSIHVYNVTLYNAVTQSVYTYGTTAYVYNGGSFGDPHIVSSSGGLDIYGGDSGSDSPNKTLKGPFVTVEIDIATGGGTDCGLAATRVQVV